MNRESAMVPVGVRVVSGINMVGGAFFVLRALGAGSGPQAAALLLGGVVAALVGIGFSRRSVMRKETWIACVLCLSASASLPIAAQTTPVGFQVGAVPQEDVWAQIRQLQQRLAELKRQYEVETRALEQAQLLAQLAQANNQTGNGFGAAIAGLNRTLQEADVRQRQNKLAQIDRERQEVQGQLNSLLQVAGRR